MAKGRTILAPVSSPHSLQGVGCVGSLKCMVSWPLDSSKMVMRQASCAGCYRRWGECRRERERAPDRGRQREGEVGSEKTAGHRRLEERKTEREREMRDHE